MEDMGTDYVTGMSVATRNKGRLTFINTFPKKKNNILLSLYTCCLERISSVGRCKCGFLDQPLDCFLIKDTSDVMEHVFFYL